jgi:tetratricopeptide (TPR) repeat protein
MNSKPTLFLACALIGLASGALGAFLTKRLAGSAVADARSGSSELAALDAVQRDLAQLREARAAETREIEALRGELALARSATERAPADLPSAVVGAAVERWLAERGQPAAVAGDGASPASSDPAGAADDGLPATVEGVVALLSDPSLSEDERQEIWQKLRDAKRLDAVVEWFEENAAEHASSPDAQVQVGEAYVAKIIEAGNGPLAGTWALKADAAWDRALELDPAHWDARFAEAIRQFETLLGYQEQAQLEPDHEQTYILLGNLYVQAGRTDDAQALWKKGLALFPQSAELAAKVQ